MDQRGRFRSMIVPPSVVGGVEPPSDLRVDLLATAADPFTFIEDDPQVTELLIDREETQYVCDDVHQVQNLRLMTDDYFDLVLKKYEELADHQIDEEQ